MENIESLQFVKFNNNGEEIELELTEEFKAAIQILEQTNESLFITGKAGSGKSSLLNYFVQNTEKNVAVLAFTGLAAINVGGETIHSFFKFPLGFIDEDQIKYKKNFEFKFKSLDVIIIDEISMTRADIIDAINKSLQVNRKSDKPFGGVQMVFVGDLYQLPPIVGNDIKDVYNKYYKTPYFFSANVFKTYRLPYVNLEKIHRQKDENFINVLNSIRERKNLDQALGLLNQHVGFSLKDIKDGDTICLTTTNKKSQEINDYFLNKINKKIFRYECKVTGDFDEKSYPTDPILELKIGAKVMFIRNDYEKTYVNGDIGIILDLNEKEIIIKLRDSEIPLKRATWEKEKYTYVPSEEEGKKGKIEKFVVGSFTQFPIKLAWSITMHKCIEENQKVKTKENGWVPIKNINVGDMVLTHNMTYKPVLNKFDSKIQDVYKITTEFGHTLIATKEHPLLSNNNWVKIENLNVDDYVTMISENNFFYKKNDDYISYLLGYLVGDGSYSGNVKKDKYRVEIMFNKVECDIINKIDTILKSFNLNHKIDINMKNRNVSRLRFQNKKFREFLYKKGLKYVKSTEKNVPNSIMNGNLNEKSNFLRGLFDSDGSVDKSHIRLVNISLDLLKNVQLILLEFGIGSSIKPMTNSKYTKNKAYLLRIITFDNKKFYENIGFDIKYKHLKLLKLINNKKSKDKSRYYIINKNFFLKKIIRKNKCLKKTSYSLKSKTLNNSILLRNKDKLYHEQYLQPFINYQHRDEKIISIEYIGMKKTYDIEVENNHSFIAQGFICHNSQGQTYNDVFIDFHNGTFTSGQAYVALSRCKSLEGMTLKRAINERDVILDYRINNFYHMFKNIFD